MKESDILEISDNYLLLTLRGEWIVVNTDLGNTCSTCQATRFARVAHSREVRTVSGSAYRHTPYDRPVHTNT